MILKVELPHTNLFLCGNLNHLLAKKIVLIEALSHSKINKTLTLKKYGKKKFNRVVADNVPPSNGGYCKRYITIYTG